MSHAHTGQGRETSAHGGVRPHRVAHTPKTDAQSHKPTPEGKDHLESGSVREVHVIPVPHGYDPEDAWMEILIYGRLIDYRWWRWRFRWPFVKWAVFEDEPPDDLERTE